MILREQVLEGKLQGGDCDGGGTQNSPFFFSDFKRDPPMRKYW